MSSAVLTMTLSRGSKWSDAGLISYTTLGRPAASSDDPMATHSAPFSFSLPFALASAVLGSSKTLWRMSGDRPDGGVR